MVSPERPIEKFEQDALERRRFVDRLRRALIDEATNRSTGVVVGLTGPWGSGKSSLLNLLHASILEDSNYTAPIIVRFDPWIVSGHNDLIEQFFAELAGSIKGTPSIGKKAEGLAKTLTKYGAHLAPIGNLIKPGMGSVFGGGIKALEAALSRDKSLYQQRSELRTLLEEINVPIVVLIDELDRVEDEEIRAIAQLVRAVLDFRGISYVLAYDPKRVIEALGNNDHERGRSYLEKIVQLQISLPITFDDELLRIIDADLEQLASTSAIPRDWRSVERYKELMQIVVPALISTPRDIARLSGAFRTLEAMLRGEVDWVDLLGYCCLLIRAPDIDEKIRRNPDLVCDNPMSAVALRFRFASDDSKLEELRTYLIGDDKRTEVLSELLGFLFPCLDNANTAPNESRDAIYRRDRLFTVMRLNLLPGRYSREEIVSVLRSPQEAIERFLRSSIGENRLSQFVDRLEDVLADINDIDHLSLWMAFSQLLRKKINRWTTQLDAFHGLPQSVARLLERLISRGIYSPSQARNWICALIDAEDVTLTSLLIRTHIFGYGLFGHSPENRANRITFLNQTEVEHFAKTLSKKYRNEHIEGNWLSGLLSLNPVYTMLDVGIWDNACKGRLNALLKSDDALVGFSILLFGMHTTERKILEAIMDYESYRSRVDEIINRPSSISLHETAVTALKKALEQHNET